MFKLKIIKSNELISKALNTKDLAERRHLLKQAIYVVGKGLGHRKSRRRQTDEEMIFALKKIIQEIGHTPSKNEMGAFDISSKATYINRFGSWDNALKLANHERIMPKIYSKTELVDLLKNAYKLLGHVPSSTEIDTLDGFPPVSVFKKIFGSWKESLIAADFLKSKRDKQYTKEELIDCFKKATSELGYIPSSQQIKNIPDFPSYRTFIRHFETWNALLTAAGYN